MPYPIVSTETYIEINIGGRKARINYADLGAGGRAKLALVLKERLQAAIDGPRGLRADFPDDEPNKTVNPNRPNEFWSDSDGVVQNNPNRNDRVTCRDTVVTDVVWDGERYVVTQVRVP
ncbi:MAG: hypothetical protein IH878_04260 [Gemmatimonadetes bacterium]|nr:hypothetical protein [Gemmatimonadota bacterium]